MKFTAKNIMVACLTATLMGSVLVEASEAGRGRGRGKSGGGFSGRGNSGRSSFKKSGNSGFQNRGRNNSGFSSRGKQNSFTPSRKSNQGRIFKGNDSRNSIGGRDRVVKSDKIRGNDFLQKNNKNRGGDFLSKNSKNRGGDFLSKNSKNRGGDFLQKNNRNRGGDFFRRNNNRHNQNFFGNRRHGRHNHFGWGWGIGRRGWGFNYGFNRSFGCNVYYGSGFRHYGCWTPQTYCNPYCVDASFVDYSAPLTVVADGSAPQGEEPQIPQSLIAAQEAFQAGDYQTAADQVTIASKELPQNVNVLQFQSLVLFALGDYQNAAAAAHVALTGGAGWDWETVRSFYTDASTYTNQLRTLEETVKSDETQVAPQFLLAYHYLMMGHREAAARRLKIVIELEPRDELAAKLLQLSEQGTTSELAEESAPADQESQEPVAEIAPDVLEPVDLTPTAPQTASLPVGQYTAKPDEGVVITMILNADQTFVWAVDADGSKSDFSGQYQLENNVLTLTRSTDSEKLVGTVTTTADGGFRFKLNNTGSDDPGLIFNR